MESKKVTESKLDALAEIFIKALKLSIPEGTDPKTGKPLMADPKILTIVAKFLKDQKWSIQRLTEEELSDAEKELMEEIPEFEKVNLSDWNDSIQ